MKKNKKKYLIIIIVSVIVLILCIFNIVKLTKNKSCFSFDSATGTITDYLCDITDVVIPSEINGVAVKKIGASAFSWNKLTSIVIPDSVKSIGSNAFYYNKLTSIVIPDSVKSIGSEAFRDNKLTSIVIPDSVKSIGSEAFRDNKLTSVVIPDSVKSIGEGAFYDNPTLTSIEVDDNNTVYDSRDNSNAIIAKRSNNLVVGCKNTIIPNTVTEINNSAFRGMGLTEIEIPNSVTSIGQSAFESNYLTSVVIPDSVTSISDCAFSSNKLINVTIGSGVEYIYMDYAAMYGPFYNNPTLTSIKVDDNNTVYDSRDNSNAIIETSTNALIQGCKTTIIPNTVTGIGYSAFYKMGLTEIQIPNSVTSIGQSAFKSNYLTSIAIPNSVEIIGKGAFHYNDNLTTIYNLSDRAFAWNGIIDGNFDDSEFITGTVTTYTGETVAIKNGALYEGYIFTSSDNKIDYSTVDNELTFTYGDYFGKITKDNYSYEEVNTDEAIEKSVKNYQSNGVVVEKVQNFWCENKKIEMLSYLLTYNDNTIVQTYFINNKNKNIDFGGVVDNLNTSDIDEDEVMGIICQVASNAVKYK